jgi:hypothetical protein
MGESRKRSVSDQGLHSNLFKEIITKRTKSQTDLKPTEPKPANKLKQIIKSALKPTKSKEYLQSLKRTLSQTCIRPKKHKNKPKKADSITIVSNPDLNSCISQNEASEGAGEPMPVGNLKNSSIILHAAAFINTYEKIYDNTLEKLDEIKFAMKENINKLIERDVNLNDLEVKAHNLNQNTLNLNLTSNKLKKKNQMPCRHWAVRIVVLFIVFLIIFIYIYKLKSLE